MKDINFNFSLIETAGITTMLYIFIVLLFTNINARYYVLSSEGLKR